jgi:hypothetical protein
LHGRKRYDGQVFAAFLVLYAVVRFALEFLRRDERGGALSLSTSQLLGLAMAAAPGFFPTAVHRIDRSPGAPLGLIFGSAALLVAFLYVLGLPFLFFCVFLFVTAWHFSSWLIALDNCRWCTAAVVVSRIGGNGLQSVACSCLDEFTI